MVIVSDVDKTAQAFVEEDDASSGFVTEEEGSDVSDANSELSDVDELEQALAKWSPQDESLADRFYALKDMVSPTTRKRIVETWNSSTTWAVWSGKLAGNAVWVATTSALLVGLPLALAIENETMMVQQEKEMLGQQQGAQQMMGSTQPGQEGIRPAGF